MEEESVLETPVILQENNILEVVQTSPKMRTSYSTEERGKRKMHDSESETLITPLSGELGKKTPPYF